MHKIFLISLSLFIAASYTLSVTAASTPLWKKEKWNKSRKLTWAKPGVSGDLSNAKSWKENGKQAKKGPDRNTDIILPASSKEYSVRGSRQNQVRHVTIDKGGELRGGHRNELEIWGNVTVKPGGFIHFISIRGDKDTFFNIEDSVFPGKGKVYRHCSKNPPRTKNCNSQISHKFQICKIGTKSVEFISNVGVSDEVMLQHGKCIISGDFRFSGATNKGAFEVYDGGILEIQSGGRIGSFCNTNRKNVYNINVYRNGVVQGGSPERPLTSDAYICLGFAENNKPGVSGLYSALGSFIRVYSSNPKKARLVFTSATSVNGFTDGNGRPIGDAKTKASGKKGIALQLAGDVQLDGVHFDYVCEGGIGLFNSESSRSWKNVSYGKMCAASSKELYSKMKADPNSYYHARGDMKSEWGLTEKAVTSMKQHLGKYDPFQLAASPDNTKVQSMGQGKNSIKTPIAVVFDKPISVTINSKVPGAKIRYTVDGTEPTKKSPSYKGAIKLSKTTKVTAKAYKSGVGYSPTYTTVYVFN
ncbi:MAG: chitobiase/beta-hexosaminidase C-terminal domain-containing protein [Planctomycetes bacterium]|nr:chitobiase/beta-hexosaminidase C-terminal domain-containing protein [Planctomycetota bacterium]